MEPQDNFFRIPITNNEADGEDPYKSTVKRLDAYFDPVHHSVGERHMFVWALNRRKAKNSENLLSEYKNTPRNVNLGIRIN